MKRGWISSQNLSRVLVCPLVKGQAGDGSQLVTQGLLVPAGAQLCPDFAFLNNLVKVIDILSEALELPQSI